MSKVKELGSDTLRYTDAIHFVTQTQGI